MYRELLEQLDDWWNSFGVSGEVEIKYADLVPFYTPIPEPNIEVKSSLLKPTAPSIATPQATSFAELMAEIEAFQGCELKAACQNTVVYDGNSQARVMVIGDAPSADDDKAGVPFVGQAGRLLDNMLAAIGLSRSEDCLITNMIYWRLPSNREPRPDELELCLPFVRRMIEIVDPAFILTFGGVPTSTLLQTDIGINQLRGQAQLLEVGGKKFTLMPNLHPSYLLRRPHDKARAWRDLLAAKKAISN